MVCDKFCFAVNKRPLAAELSAKDIVYGEEVDAEIAFAGFAYDEDASVLCEGEMTVFNEEGDEVKGILPAGEYTLAARGTARTITTCRPHTQNSRCKRKNWQLRR